MGKNRRDTGFKRLQAESAGIEAAPPENEQEAPPEIYDDVSVCRALGIRRRILQQARTKQAFGKDWNCVAFHAGMTFDWVNRKANELGMTTAALVGKIRPIEANDGVYSCRLKNTFPNRRRVAVELTNGRIELATVKDSTLMRLGEVFDCRLDQDGRLVWASDLNDVKY